MPERSSSSSSDQPGGRRVGSRADADRPAAGDDLQVEEDHVEDAMLDAARWMLAGPTAGLGPPALCPVRRSTAAN
jgi:hypothetical protein